MNFTGEQYIPGKTKKRLEEEHIERYNFLKQFVKNKIVLDVACGTGYGTKILKQAGAKEVFGLDLSPDAIKYAEDQNLISGVHFSIGDVTKKIFQSGFFDVIVSFETIEHLNAEDRKRYLENISKWLKEEGKFFISTPNRKIVSPFLKTPLNSFHLFEFDLNDLKKEVTEYFVIEECLGQRFINVIFLNFFIRKTIFAIQKFFKINLHVYDFANSPEVKNAIKGSEPRIFILICRKK